jgi:hypothetical protein
MILERLSRFWRKSKSHEKGDTPSYGVSGAATTGEWMNHQPHPNELTPFQDVINGFFANATNFTINNANFIDRSQISQTIHNTIATGTAGI